MSKLKQAYIRLLEIMNRDEELTKTPIYDALEREWVARGFLPIGK